MTPPFTTSREKIAWAEKRINDLYWELHAFASSDPYEKVIETHPDKPDHVVHKMRLTRDIPGATINLAREIIQGLRSALDNAVFAIALSAGVKDPRNAAFPFAGTIADMASALGRCKDIPAQIHPLFCGFQPYRDGNEYLWALNKLSNTDKHRLLLPFGAGVFRSYGSVQGIGGYFEMPDPHVWDTSKNEMVILTLGPGITCEYQFDFQVYAAFADIEGLAGQDAFKKLLGIGASVHRVLCAIEAECRRQKIIT